MGICFDKAPGRHIPISQQMDITPLTKSSAVIIFVVGGPGVGKSTLCRKLTAKYGLVLIWVSNILREEVDSGSERGQLFKAIMAKGENVPAEIIVQLVVKKMLEYPQAIGYLIVGFPRDKKQAVLFNTEVRSPTLLLNLYARRVILQDRMAKRAAESARFDDTAEAVCNRVIKYYTHIKGAIAPNKRVTKVIDAETTADEVYRQACRIIDEIIKVPKNH
ncbi:Adenylate kinase isoenzyme 1 [Anthophora retusa]